MKKTLLMGAMALAIVTSMVAGTLAVYSKNFNFEGNVSAKKFYVDASSEVANPDITIAPNETASWEFEVTNTDGTIVSAVDMSTNITVTLPNGFKDINATLKDAEGNVLGTGVANNNGTININGADFTAATPKTDKYTLEFHWNGSADNANDTALGEAGTSSGFTVTVTGTQK